jgi:chromosome partitioning protein
MQNGVGTMAGKTVTVAQQKGGAGKTTLAVHLADAWSRAGHSVALVDIDPQGSLSAWFELRPVDAQPPLSLARITGWRTENEVRRLVGLHDIVVVDSPPHAETEAKLAVRVADLVLVPVQPSPMDLWATRPTLDLAAREKRKVLLVLNRVPSRTKLGEAVQAKVRELGAPVAVSEIGNRTGFAAAMMEGRTVLSDARRGRAQEEIEALAAEVLARLG